jgi:AcrR family transcriptional regulator
VSRPDPAPASKPRRRARGSLSEGEIINAAIALVERDGVNGLSMPILARYLDAGVMSIYTYFHSKDDLLLAMADRAFLDVLARLPPVPNGPWETEMIEVVTTLLSVFRENRLYLTLCRALPRALVLRPAVMPVIARRLATELQLFEEGSVGLSDALRFLIVGGAYVRGFALMQLGAEEERDHQTPEAALEAAVHQLNPDKFPLLRGANNLGDIISVSDERFDRTFRLMVAGLKAECGSGPERNSDSS